MKSYMRYFGLVALLFMALFTVQRHLFLAFSHQHLAGIGWREIVQSHFHGLPMDLATTGYMLLLASLFAIPLLFNESKVLRMAVRFVLVSCIVVSALVNVVDIGLFDAWGVRIDRKALSYLRYPAEVAGSMALGRMVMLLLVAAVQCLFFLFLLKKIDHFRDFRKGKRGARIATAVLVPVLCVLAARGGPQDDPINKSWAWFSTKPVLNL
ncbi:MAG: hypothetical protein KBF49_11340, partial [Flavobacteriales bacterium]|nr:hypothetical protein [Flavobacteriales bacterium]